MIKNQNPNYKKALFLEYITIGWNVFEGLSSVLIGIFTGSVSLFAYGLESSIEVFASSLVVWELKGIGKKREKIALKLIGSAYLVVSAYIFIHSIKNYLEGNQPQRSIWGIILMVITAIVMVSLGLAKKRAGENLGSLTVLADAKFTLIDAALSISVLVGLMFNTLFGWWWTDLAMALFLSGVAFREGMREIL